MAEVEAAVEEVVSAEAAEVREAGDEVDLVEDAAAAEAVEVLEDEEAAADSAVEVDEEAEVEEEDEGGGSISEHLFYEKKILNIINQPE